MIIAPFAFIDFNSLFAEITISDSITLIIKSTIKSIANIKPYFFETSHINFPLMINVVAANRKNDVIVYHIHLQVPHHIQNL